MSSRPARIALTTAGVVCVGLGTAGLFVPILPTTPFLLLAGACFVRSSPRLHVWLVEHPRLGPYVAGFLDHRGVPRRVKRVTLLTLWPFISLSIVIVLVGGGSKTTKSAATAFLLLVAVLVTRYVLRQPTRSEDPPERSGT